MDVRKATQADIEAAVGIAERSRRQFQKYQPRFWRKAPNSIEASRAALTALLSAADTYFLVAIEGSQLMGFLVAQKHPVPPVYAPGGDTWLVDDFHVVEAQHWLTTGEALLSHVSTLVHEHGAAHIVVTCADRDLAKTEMLRRAGLAIATSRWTRSLT